jgi:hypothetical protein
MRRLGKLSRRSKPEAAALDSQAEALLAHATDADRRIVQAALPHSMTGPARLLALVDAVRYCMARSIPGAFAECGVWRGGSILAMILTLQDLKVADRHIYLYDTFEGMTEPTVHDVSLLDPPALHTWRQAQSEQRQAWEDLFAADAVGEETVRTLLSATGYPDELLHFVRGPVEQTLPDHVPAELALLRLDTDWYESTRHELTHLFPRLSIGGVLIIDDYGHWQGARKAVDEYLVSEERQLLLTRVDYTARIAVKV